MPQADKGSETQGAGVGAVSGWCSWLCCLAEPLLQGPRSPLQPLALAVSQWEAVDAAVLPRALVTAHPAPAVIFLLPFQALGSRAAVPGWREEGHLLPEPQAH